MRRRLDLTLGPCRWENALRHVLAGSGLILLLTAPTAGTWKLLVIALLGLTWFWSAEPRARGGRQVFRLYPDGAAGVWTGGCETPVELTGRAWTSPFLCVFELRDLATGRLFWHRACATRNAAADYRRLSGLLRLRAVRAGEECLD